MPDPKILATLETLEREGQTALDGMREEMKRRQTGRPKGEIPDLFVGQVEFGRWTTQVKTAFRRIGHEPSKEFDGDCTVGRMEIALGAFKGVVQSYRAGLHDPAPAPSAIEAKPPPSDHLKKKGSTLGKTVAKGFGAFVAVAAVFGAGFTAGTTWSGYQDARNKSLAMEVLKACGAPEKDQTMADGLEKLLVIAKGMCGPKGSNAQPPVVSSASAAPPASAASSDSAARPPSTAPSAPVMPVATPKGTASGTAQAPTRQRAVNTASAPSGVGNSP